MNYVLIKRVAIFVIMAFTITVILPQYNFPQNKGIKEELVIVNDLYKKKNFEKAQELIEKIILRYGSDESQYRDELCSVCYFKAKIHFIFGEKDEMKKALRKLYRMYFGFILPENEHKDFREIVEEIKEEIKKEWEQEKKKKEKKTPEKKIKKKEKTEPKEKVIEKEKGDKKGKKKKKFPWLLVAGGVIVVGALVYFLSKKKPEKKTLSVTVGEGVEGIPANGTYTYKKGETVSYSYSLKSGYHVLNVKLDGNEVASSGTLKMDQNHTLTATASKQYTLTVVKGEGVNGTPDSGIFPHKEGETVSYNYTLKEGFENLKVTLDGSPVPASGTITINKDHTLIASSGKTYQLTVDKGEGVDGTPEKGTFSYQEGETVNYSYSLQEGYDNLFVTLDGIQVASSGTIPMDRDHTLTVSATRIGEYTLKVTKEEGVDGSPESGRYTYKSGKTIDYNYSLQDGYKDLVVELDGNPDSASGTITMNKNHTLKASATAIGKYNLTVTKGEGVNGTPHSGTSTHNEGDLVAYGYTLQDGYKDLVVTLDGNPVSASGTITMNENHKLDASATPIGEYTLNVTKGEGVDGTPETGSHKYEPGETVKYDYSLLDGYKELVVTLDGEPVSASGTVTMDGNHTLSASATATGKCTLTVTKGTGVNGTPNSGTFSYNEGETVDYSYTLQDGYKNLVVTLDGEQVSASGTVTMNMNHTLNASATPKKEYTLTVTKGEGVNGTPDSGTFTYTEGKTVDYSYSIDTNEYQDLVVKLDGNIVPASGTITMNANHTLIASATKRWKLTVTRDEGVDGNPVTGTYTFADGSTQSYSYSLQSGYKDLVVKLDGNKVAASGNITMNSDHTLTASATATASQKDKK